MKKYFLILFSFFLLSADYLRPPSLLTTDTNAKIKAVFLYNFTKYIEWPKEYKEGNFVIGILGNTGFYTELTNVLSNKNVGSQTFQIKSFATIDAITKCHMLFIPSENSINMKEILAKVKGKSTLIVTEKNGMAKQGAAINFIIQENKQKFELNKSNVEKYDLKVGSNLMSLAILVE